MAKSKIQIFYPDNDLINQVNQWFTQLQKTTVDIYENDDFSKVEISTEHQIMLTKHDNITTLYVGPALLMVKDNQYENICVY